MKISEVVTLQLSFQFLVNKWDFWKKQNFFFKSSYKTRNIFFSYLKKNVFKIFFSFLLYKVHWNQPLTLFGTPEFYSKTFDDFMYIFLIQLLVSLIFELNLFLLTLSKMIRIKFRFSKLFFMKPKLCWKFLGVKPPEYKLNLLNANL